jgi:hypothetical protein
MVTHRITLALFRRANSLSEKTTFVNDLLGLVIIFMF